MAGKREQSRRLTQDEAFTTLSNTRRRYVLEHLADSGGSATIGDLAEAIAARENDKPVEAVTGKERRRVYTALQQSHLPKMDAVGVVEYDHGRGTVDITPGATQLQVYLEVIQGNEIPWSEYYLALSAVCGGVVTAAWIGAVPVDVSGFVYAAGIVAVFFLSAVFHVLHMRERRLGFAEGSDAVDGGIGETLASDGATDADGEDGADDDPTDADGEDTAPDDPAESEPPEPTAESDPPEPTAESDPPEPTAESDPPDSTTGDRR